MQVQQIRNIRANRLDNLPALRITNANVRPLQLNPRLGSVRKHLPNNRLHKVENCRARISTRKEHNGAA
jgi:hypothetical protein